MRPFPASAAVLCVVCLLATTPAHADEHSIEIGLRASAMHLSRSTAENMLGAGLVWRYHVRDDWFVAFSLDSYNYDLVLPQQMSAVTVPVRTTVFSTALGKRKNVRDSGFDWFWHAGIGVGIAVASGRGGASESGQPIDVHVETGTEIHLSATLGSAYHFSPQWALIAAGRAQHQFIDLQASDRRSGDAYAIDSLSPVGVFLSLNYRF